MDDLNDNNVAVLAILEDQSAVYKQNMTVASFTHGQQINQEDVDNNETSRQSTVWTKEATLILLSIYETKIQMLDNPKKKSKMWQPMAEDLKTYNIEVTPDQVRWKINALTKKYKDCIGNGQVSMTFKYFNEMHQILGTHSDSSSTYRIASDVTESENIHKNKKNLQAKTSMPFRKLRAERRAKVELDKQWIEYINRQDQLKQIRDERYERSLRLREEELQLRKKELEIKQAIALKKLQLKEQKQEEILKIEKEKCSLLRKLISNQELLNQ